VSHTCLTSGTNAQYVLCEAPGSKARPQARRNEHRKPRRSFVTTRRFADAFGRVCWVTASPATGRSRASASPGFGVFDDRAEGEGCDAMGGASRTCHLGALGSTARSLAAKSQTNLELSVRAAWFATQERNAPCSRQIQRGRTSCSDCRGSWRPPERNGAEAQLAKRTRKWSGAVAKLASQSSCAGETVPMLARRERVRRLRLSPTKRWRRL